MVAFPYLGPIVALALFFFFILHHFLKTNNGIPRNYPLVGMTPMLLVNYNHLYHTMYEILTRTEGTLFIKGLWFTNTDMLLTSDPKNIHYITTKNFSNYPKGAKSAEIFDALLGTSLFNLDFEEWSYYRKILHDYLRQPQFHTFFNRAVESVNRRLLPVLQHVAEQGMVVDASDLFVRRFLDSAWLICTGYELDSLSADFPENPFANAIEVACQAIFYRHVCPPMIWKLQRLLKLGSEKKLHDAKKTLREIVQDCISMRRDKLFLKKSEHEDSYDLLKYTLLNPLETGEEPHPEEVVRDSILGLTFATYETTSTTLSWLFWLLSKHPDVEAKIRQEIVDISSQVSQGTTWRVTNKEYLSKLVYLHAVICETLRLYSPVPFTHRTPVKSDVLPSGHHVSPTTRVVLSAYSVGRMKAIWGEDSLEFRPERWIDNNGNIKYVPSTKIFMFHAGPRICPGKDMAFTLLKATAATIIYNFHIEVVETMPPTPKASFVLQMKHGIKVKVKMLI